MSNRSNEQTAATREDLRYMGETLTEAMRDGFRGVHERQDRTNGRVGITEKDLAVLAERVQTIVANIKTIFGMLNRRLLQRTEGDVELATVPRSKYPQKVIVPSVAAAAIAGFEALQRIVPAVMEAFFK